MTEGIRIHVIAGVPKEAQIVGAFFAQDGFNLVIEHESFPQIDPNFALQPHLVSWVIEGEAVTDNEEESQSES